MSYDDGATWRRVPVTAAGRDSWLAWLTPPAKGFVSLRAGGLDEVFIARRVAWLSRHLPADRVGVLDTAIARIIAHEAGGRVLAVAEAKVIEADPALHDERVEAEKARRYVSSGRTDSSARERTLAVRSSAPSIGCSSARKCSASLSSGALSSSVLDARGMLRIAITRHGAPPA